MGLVETLVAIAILSVGITAFMTSLSTGSIAVNTQGEQAIAQRLAQAQMESIKALPYDSTGASYNQISPPEGYTLSLDVDSTLYADSNIQRVSVTVLHQENQVLVLEDYKVNR